MLDIHLRPHVPVLYEQIRQRALKQYVSPFMSVNLNKMAQVFPMTDAQPRLVVGGLFWWVVFAAGFGGFESHPGPRDGT